MLCMSDFLCIKLTAVFSHINAATHIMTDRNDPAGAASPIGSSVSANILDARYEPGTLTSTIAAILWINPM